MDSEDELAVEDFEQIRNAGNIMMKMIESRADRSDSAIIELYKGVLNAQKILLTAQRREIRKLKRKREEEKPPTVNKQTMVPKPADSVIYNYAGRVI
jgi:hypothetical protein